MAWRGFTEESKRYIGYPALINTQGAVCWARFVDMNQEEKRHAIRFWLRFPIAYCKFGWYGMRYELRLWWARKRYGNA